MDIARQEAEMLAQELALGQTRYARCPVCDGAKKFSVTRLAHSIVWNCFRDSCPVKGHSVTSYATIPARPAEKKPWKLRPYTGVLQQPSAGCLQWLIDHYDILNPERLRMDDRGRFALPVQDPSEWERGWGLRDPTSWGAPWAVDWDGPKTMLYMHSQGPSQSWYPASDCNTVVLVEDMLSAMVCQAGGVSACALLGTQLDNDKVREIGQGMWKQVIIALDNDATESAFKLARKWGLAFNRTRVVPLERDLKEEDCDDVREILGL